MEYTASLHSSKGLCVMTILRYAFSALFLFMPLCVTPFCAMAVCVMAFCVIPLCVMPLFRDGHLQNRLVAIQLWIDAFMI